MASSPSGWKRTLPWPRIAAAVVALALVLGSVAGALVLNSRLALRPGPNEFNIVAWELRHFPGKWLFMAGELLRGSMSEEQQDAYLRRFFELNREIRELESQLSDVAQRNEAANPEDQAHLDDLLDERDRIQNQVEYTLESRIATVLREEGLTRDFGVELLWPPVDTRFASSPRVLATSPRERIELTSSRLLREDLTLEEAEHIERETEAERGVSALSFATGGIGAYPTIVEYPMDYYRAVEVVAHEWMHNYLFFRPLGFHYYSSNDLRTMNETVADLVGNEIAVIVVERWPIEPPPPEPTPTPAPPDPDDEAPEEPEEPRLDLREELVALRGAVDELLAQGRIGEAEARMEEKRRELAEHGYRIRRINQAYFAYLNLYAGADGSAAATNPLGPKIDELRRLSPSLSHFVDIAGSLTSPEQLDEALAHIRG